MFDPNVTNSNPLISLSVQPQTPEKGSKANPYRVLHTTLEFTGAVLGGLGSVVSTLVPSQNQYGQILEMNIKDAKRFQKVKVITPGYDFLFKADSSIKLKGKYSHHFNGSALAFSIYKRKLPNAITHYLVVPDPDRASLFNVGSAEQIYSSFPYSESQNRWTYFSSAAAAFSSFSKNKNGTTKFDIVHCHAWQTAFITSIIKEKCLPLLSQSGEKAPTVVSTFHLFTGEQGYLENSSEANKIGLNRAADINQAAEMMLHSDFITTVSHSMLVEAACPVTGYHLDHLFRGALEQNCITGISNGINTEEWSPSNAKKMGPWAFTKAHILEGKHKLKHHLVSEGLLTDPSKRLVVFVGRYSREKGIDMLEHAIEEVLAQGGSFICMGLFTSDKISENIVRLLEKRYQNHPDVHIMLTCEEQERFGHFVRAAADFTLVPSHKEACGLVPMEAFCSGSLVISSAEQGLKDILRDILMHPEGSQIGNSFTYFNGPGREFNIKACIRTAFAYLSSLTSLQEQEIRARIMDSSAFFDWNAKEGPLEKMFFAYKRALERNSISENNQQEKQKPI